ncbi:hypothetical protein Ancab_028115, partial [Ancistrocladus abbreviatus]
GGAHDLSKKPSNGLRLAPCQGEEEDLFIRRVVLRSSEDLVLRVGRRSLGVSWTELGCLMFTQELGPSRKWSSLQSTFVSCAFVLRFCCKCLMLQLLLVSPAFVFFEGVAAREVLVAFLASDGDVATAAAEIVGG